MASSNSLDDEIETLQAKVYSLKKQIRVQTSTLIASPSTRQLLEDNNQRSGDFHIPDDEGPLHQSLLAPSDAQIAHNQQSLYRTFAPITAFKVRDPDPNAVDDGFVLGIRIEVVMRGKFLRPYYVLLNRPYPGNQRHFRVHRHTVPPCIPLSGFAARYLPSPVVRREDDSSEKEKVKNQNLSLFVRSLRREILRYHNRLGMVADLRNAAGLGKQSDENERPEAELVNIAPADSEAKHISLEWADGRTGRLVVGDDGEIVKLVALGENGRDREAVRSLLKGARRVEEVTKRLARG
ncbi:Cenp-O kinetochore centromere component domain containing protein [Naviculisporaceae sp. PSN 640]